MLRHLSIVRLPAIGSARVGQLNRAMSSQTASVLRYTEYGDPLQVLRRHEEPLVPPKDAEVLVKMLLAPINPADINTIQGTHICSLIAVVWRN